MESLRPLGRPLPWRFWIPLQYSRSIIVFATGSLAGCFLMPMALALFWLRKPLGLALSLAGIESCGTHILLYLIGFAVRGKFIVYAVSGYRVPCLGHSSIHDSRSGGELY